MESVDEDNLIKDSSLDFLSNLLSRFGLTKSKCYEKVFNEYGVKLDKWNGYKGMDLTWTSFNDVLTTVASVKGLYMAKAAAKKFEEKWLLIIESDLLLKDVWVCQITKAGNIHITSERYHYTRGPYNLTRYDVSSATRVGESDGEEGELNATMTGGVVNSNDVSIPGHFLVEFWKYGFSLQGKIYFILSLFLFVSAIWLTAKNYYSEGHTRSNMINKILDMSLLPISALLFELALEVFIVKFKCKYFSKVTEWWDMFNKVFNNALTNLGLLWIMWVSYEGDPILSAFVFVFYCISRSHSVMLRHDKVADWLNKFRSARVVNGFHYITLIPLRLYREMNIDEMSPYSSLLYLIAILKKRGYTLECYTNKFKVSVDNGSINADYYYSFSVANNVLIVGDACDNTNLGASTPVDFVIN